MIVSANMSLTVWDSVNDAYSHTQLASNFLTLDTHNHTDTKGVQIPTGGIQESAITSSKIADNAVTAAKIPNNSVAPSKLTFGIAKVGDVQMIWRPNDLTSLQPWYDDGWALANGQTLDAFNHNFEGGGSITLPNMNGKFPVGAALTGGGANLPASPAVGQAGGSNTKNLSHVHAVHNEDVTYTRENYYDQFFLGNGYGYGYGFGYNLRSSVKTKPALSDALDIRPAFVGFIFLIKVKK